MRAPTVFVLLLAAARAELRELKTVTSERWDAAKTRLSASLQELKTSSKKPLRDSWTRRVPLAVLGLRCGRNR